MKFKKCLTVFLSVCMVVTLMPVLTFAEGAEGIGSTDLTSVDVTGTSEKSVRDLAGNLYSTNGKFFSSRSGGFSWDTENKKRSWTYYNGIMMDAFLMLDSDSYMDAVNRFYDANVSTRGEVDGTGASDNYYRTSELDSIPPTRALFDLLRSDGLTQQQRTKYIKMIQYVYSIMMKFETVDGTNGNFKHKMNNNNWNTYQIALDGLYMAQPFFMELGNALDDGTIRPGEWSAPPSSHALYTDVVNRMSWIGEHLYDADTGLYNHGCGPQADVNHQYWLRAVGWYAAALADVIHMLPEDMESERTSLISTEEKLFDGMLRYQDDDTGMWYNVINYGPDLQGTEDSKSKNRLESSGTALLAYAMMKSYVDGYIGDYCGEAGLRAFNGTVTNALDAQGLQDVYLSSGVEKTAGGYLKKPYKTNEAKGVGPLMMAACYAAEAAEKYAASQVVSHDVIVSAPIANGEVATSSGCAAEGETVTLTVTPQEGYELDELTVTGTDPEGQTQSLQLTGTGNTRTFLMPAYAVSVSATFRPVQPLILKHSLILSSEIGVRFRVTFPENSDLEGCRMDFVAADGRTESMPLEQAEKIADSNDYYFTCYINALELADDIEATLHFGTEDRTITDHYSAMAYIAYVQQNMSDNEKLLHLVNALQDYGYYMQQSGWKDDKDSHTPISRYTEFNDDSITAAKNGVHEMGLTKELNDSGIADVKFALSLNEATVIRVSFKPDSETSITSTGGKSRIIEGETYYQFTTAKIGAANLGKIYPVTVQTNRGTATVKASAMSYVHTVLNSEAFADAQKYAMTSYYNYYKAADEYVKS